MEYLHNGFTLELCDGAFPLSTDSIALAGFVSLPKNARVLDLGSGCGTLGMLLCASNADCHITGIEKKQEDHLCAMQNASRNHIEDRFTSICGSWQQIPSLFPSGGFHVCVSNPPYFTNGVQSAVYGRARHEDGNSLQELFKSAQWALKFGGDFFIVHKPQRLAELCAVAVEHHLEPKKILFLRHHPEAEISLVLMQCRKGAKAGVILSENYLYDSNHQPSAYYKAIYHL